IRLRYFCQSLCLSYLEKIQRQPPPTLFPYTTLFRSDCVVTVCAAASAGASSAQQAASGARPRVIAGAAPAAASRRDRAARARARDRKSTRLNSSHVKISYAVFCLKKKKEKELIKT